MIVTTPVLEKIDRKELIKSYGFVEQLSSNENFLQESLQLAARTTGTKYSYISLLDDENQYILSQNGSNLLTIPVENTICQFTIKGDEPLVIEDARKDARTKDLPMVKEEDGIVFYVGCPLVNSENIKIGALCVMDTDPRHLNALQLDILKIIAKQVMDKLETQRGLIKLIKKINTNFRPAACADLYCLQGELNHLQDEVIIQHETIKRHKIVLEQANEKLSDFAHVVAHDVRAPLRTINNFVQILEKDLQKSNATYKKELIEFIKKATLNLDELTKGLLEYAEADNDTSTLEKLDLNQIIETVIFNLTETIRSKKAKIILPEETYFVKGQKLQLIQLFQNLISNGIKYQNGGEVPIITIQTSEEGDSIQVSVRDNGIGISQEDLAKIFEPFKRLHSAGRFRGSGIGLATCYKILENLGSKFTVTSELGKGSVFSFHLPKAGLVSRP